MSNNKLVRCAAAVTAASEDTHGAVPEALPVCKLQHPVIKLLTILWSHNHGTALFQPLRPKSDGTHILLCVRQKRCIVTTARRAPKIQLPHPLTIPEFCMEMRIKRKKMYCRNENGENWLKGWIKGRVAPDPVREMVTASRSSDGGIFTSGVWCCTINAGFTHEGAICTCTKAGGGTLRWQTRWWTNQQSELGWLTGQKGWGHPLRQQ